MKYNKNEKLFNIYVFLTTFSRNLIEVFIGTILFKAGFTFHEVVLYFVLSYFFSIIVAIPSVYVSKKYSNKLLALISVAAFIVLHIMLNRVSLDVPYLIITAFLFALYRKTYWVSRRYYTMQLVSRQENVARKYSIISAVNQLGIIVSSYAGALLLQFISVTAVTIISFVLLAASVLFLHLIKIKEEHSSIKIRPLKTLKDIPFSSAMHILCYELGNISKCLFPLFVIIYVRDTYTTVGVVTLLANVASLVFIYVYGRITNGKQNFLKLSLFLYVAVKVLQVSTTGFFLMVASFLEGFILKMYEQSFHKEYLTLARRFDHYNFNLAYEIIENVGRFVVLGLLFLFVGDVRTMIYISFGIMALGLLFKFKK